jgi:nitroreductase
MLETMNINEALQWRYAVKRMTGQNVPQEIVDQIIGAALLSPSGIGLQPYEILVVTNPELKAKILPIAFNQHQVVECSHLLIFAAWEEYTETRINRVFEHLSLERGAQSEISDRQRKFAIQYFNQFTKEENFHHAAKQAHIALGLAVAAASLALIDNTPMEGFDAKQLDILLDLKSKGLRSSMLLALGYRDPELDWNHPLKKVRKPLEEFITAYK